MCPFSTLFAIVHRPRGGRSIPKKDNTTSYKGKKHQILSTQTKLGFAKAKIEVQKHLDGTIHIFYKEEELPFKTIILQEDEGYVSSQKKALLVGVRHFHFAERMT